MTSAAHALQQLREAAAMIGERAGAVPDAAIILGTGLGRLGEAIEVREVVPYEEIPGFALSTVESHRGRLLIGTVAGRQVIALQGRFHRYEGYTLQQVVFPVRALRLAGVETLLVSNACGGMNPLWRPGDIMAIDDHINLLGDNPLVGPNLDALGPRFPDMSEPYDRELLLLAESCALELGLPLRRGVYVAVTGPNLETRAEYRMLRAMGADVVGMSTVPEVIAARHAGMRVLGFSITTDACLPDALEPTDLAAIVRTAQAAEPRLAALITRILERLPGRVPSN